MRVLLLSMYYPPLNTIAAQRVKSFASYLSEENFVVDVITRYYDTEQQKGKSMFLGKEPARDFTLEYLREGNVIYTNFAAHNKKLAFSGKLPPVIRGVYNYLNVDVFHYGWLDLVHNAFEKEFAANKYDFIIASYGPPIVMLVAKQLSEKYAIPFVIDFRDSYIDEKDTSFHRVIKKMVLKKSLSKASGIVYSTDGMKTYVEKAVPSLSSKPSCVVYNGMGDVIEGNLENDILNEFRQIKSRHSLLLLHTGTLYEGQNISFFTDAVEKYNALYEKNVVIVFLGLSENRMLELPQNSSVYFLPKVNHKTSLCFQQEASALLLPIWDGRYTGFSGKTQEYLFSGNYIITSPEPQADLRLFLDLSPNVYISRDYVSFFETLNGLIEGTYSKRPLLNSEKLLRSYWVIQLSRFLKKISAHE